MSKLDDLEGGLKKAERGFAIAAAAWALVSKVRKLWKERHGKKADKAVDAAKKKLDKARAKAGTSNDRKAIEDKARSKGFWPYGPM
jgi:hypothetical protein